MRSDNRANGVRAAALGASLVATLATGAFVHELFAPAAVSLGEHVASMPSRADAIEVAIVPARIEVVARRSRELAESARPLPSNSPGG